MTTATKGWLQRNRRFVFYMPRRWGDEFEEVCKQTGKTVSQVLREYAMLQIAFPNKGDGVDGKPS